VWWLKLALCPLQIVEREGPDRAAGFWVWWGLGLRNAIMEGWGKGVSF